jgi:ribonuclease-3
MKIRYELLEEHGVPHDKTFIMAIYLNNEEMGIGKGKNKKEAEQSAAKEAMINLNMIR